ncbi:energy transducer TonB [Pseudoduganella sp. HUAS MS19]
MLSLLLALAVGGAFPYQSLATPASCTAPAWPREALRYEIEGTTTLEFRIGSDGAVRDAKVRGGSGWAMLDQAALAGLARCRFKPGLEAAREDTVFPIQYAWRLDGPAPLRPVLQVGSCAASRRFLRYDNLDQRPDGRAAIKLRFMVDAEGKAQRIVPETAHFDTIVRQDAMDWLQTCRFGISPKTSGEHTDTSFGWVVLR